MTTMQKPLSIPEPTNDPDSLWRTAQALKEAVEIIQGIRGNRAAVIESDFQTILANIEDRLDALENP